MTKQIVAFLIGAAIASAWWSLAVMPHDARGSQWVLPAVCTFGFFFVGLGFCLAHWDQ